MPDSDLPAPVSDRLATWKELDWRHVEVSLPIFLLGLPYGGFEVFAITALGRSSALLRGFETLVHAQNLVAAIPLIRLQLDSTLRFTAAGMVSDVDSFATEVIKGNAVRRLRDRVGTRLTDAYLLEQVAAANPWVRPLYENTSGYVHLSDRHILNTFKSQGVDGDLKILLGLTETPTEEAIVEAIANFERATNLLLDTIENAFKTHLKTRE